MICERRFRLKKNGNPISICFCRTPELIENYEKAIADKTQTWFCHHRNEMFYTMQELIDLGLYFDCPPCELIFLTREEHEKQYHKGKSGKEARDKKSKEQKGKKRGHCSEESKRKISEAMKGKHWYNNGKAEIIAFECPEGFVPGRLR